MVEEVVTTYLQIPGEEDRSSELTGPGPGQNSPCLRSVTWHITNSPERPSKSEIAPEKTQAWETAEKAPKGWILEKRNSEPFANEFRMTKTKTCFPE